ncbi:hypothetical protein [Puniceicoccus vermicola]|uniref:Lipoprotein n=1 Tax=Puniceicoccus vermicola TaxID=388746 RepID=A0A7X1AXD4_9BACT|nr:hypothetical protein [Puniceicoccus vermicola]MBC2600733.1 hypothetical protein [Puniceicoccus vermicola]
MKRFLISSFLVGLLTLVAGCRSTTIEDPHVPTIYLESTSSIPGREDPYVTLPISESRYRLPQRPLFGPMDIIRIEMVQVERGLAVRYLLTPSASRQLRRTSGDAIGYSFIFFDNQSPIGARKIDGMIDDGILYTFLEVSDEDMPQLVVDMNRTLVEFRRNNR